MGRMESQIGSMLIGLVLNVYDRDTNRPNPPKIFGPKVNPAYAPVLVGPTRLDMQSLV